MNITKQQWDELISDQKEFFQEIVYKKYKTEIYPSSMDIGHFLNDNGIKDYGFKKLGKFDSASEIEDIDILWEKVLSFFKNR